MMMVVFYIVLGIIALIIVWLYLMRPGSRWGLPKHFGS